MTTPLCSEAFRIIRKIYGNKFEKKERARRKT